MEQLITLRNTLITQRDNLEEDVEEAYEDQEGMCSGEYDFGHPQDSFDAGWDRGETVGEYKALNDVIELITTIVEDSDA